MNFNDIKIVADSSADLLFLEDISFASAPLKIITADKEFVDDADLDVEYMADYLQSYNGKSSTSCPNTADWLDAFGDAKYVFCITITATLSGSYNAACLAKLTYEETFPERKVFVLNSLSTGPEMVLVLNKFKECILNGMSFDNACEYAAEYSNKTGLIFMLESLNNLANNGRVGPLVAKMGGFLGIRMVGKASHKGDLEPLNKCRGEKKALNTIVERLIDLGYNGGKIRIMHCINENAAITLKSLVTEKFPAADVEIGQSRGLCTFYAEKGGLLIGFEKDI